MNKQTEEYEVDTIELKKIMLEHGIETKYELSTITGIHRNTLSKILDGKIKPSFRSMCSIISSLQISPTKAGEIFFKNKLA